MGFSFQQEAQKLPDLLCHLTNRYHRQFYGDKHLSFQAKTLCSPGARVQDITGLLPTVSCQNTGDVAVHVASNDIRVASSEWLKQDFIELIGTLKHSKKRPIISGPVPSLSRSSEDSVGCWHDSTGYESYCCSVGLTLIHFGNRRRYTERMGSIQFILVPGPCPHILRLR